MRPNSTKSPELRPRRRASQTYFFKYQLARNPLKVEEKDLKLALLASLEHSNSSNGTAKTAYEKKPLQKREPPDEDYLKKYKPETEDFLTFICFRSTSTLCKLTNINNSPTNNDRHSPKNHRRPTRRSPRLARVSRKFSENDSSNQTIGTSTTAYDNSITYEEDMKRASIALEDMAQEINSSDDIHNKVAQNSSNGISKLTSPYRNNKHLVKGLMTREFAGAFADEETIFETSETESSNQVENLDSISNLIKESSKSIPSNHRTTEQEETPSSSRFGASGRNGRQYDGSMTSSGSGSYGSITGDGAYVAQLPISSSNFGGSASSSAANYAQDMSGSYHSIPSYHDPMTMARGYPASSPSLSNMHASAAGYPGLSSMFSPSMSGSSLMASSMFPLMSKGFDVSEIVCTAIAVAIGAVIVGAPFILIYLFVMNQMNGGGSNMGPSGGAISLTGPNSNTNVSGRKKRQTSLPEALFKQLSPLVNNEQVASTFRSLMSSIAKYQM